MITRGPSRPQALLLALAIGLAACDDRPPGPTAPAATDLPSDHPPLGAEATTRPPALPPETVLATAGAHQVTAGEVDAAINALPSPDRHEMTTSENIRELVESLVDRKLMAEAARAGGLDDDSAVKERLGEGATVDEQMLAGLWLERELATVPPPADAAVASYYREHRAEFTEPARVRVTRVIAADEASAGTVKAALARGATRAELQALVPDSARSVEELWLHDVPKQPELTAAALALKRGEVSAVLPAANGYAVMRAEERAGERVRPLEEVRDGIRAQLEDGARRERRAGIRERLRAGVPVAIDEGRLASYLPPTAAAN